MILCDESIEQYVDRWEMIAPYNEKQLQPASYDLRLADIQGGVVFGTDQWMIRPKEFVLGSTVEKICLPSNIVGRIEGKSSWARKGLWIHAAGFIDPGFCGTLTLEIINQSNDVIPLTRDILIAQISFQTMDKAARRPYGHPDLNSHYQGQDGVTKSAL